MGLPDRVGLCLRMAARGGNMSRQLPCSRPGAVTPGAFWARARPDWGRHATIFMRHVWWWLEMEKRPKTPQIKCDRK